MNCLTIPVYISTPLPRQKNEFHKNWVSYMLIFPYLSSFSDFIHFFIFTYQFFELVWIWLTDRTADGSLDGLFITIWLE